MGYAYLPLLTVTFEYIYQIHNNRFIVLMQRVARCQVRPIVWSCELNLGTEALSKWLNNFMFLLKISYWQAVLGSDTVWESSSKHKYEINSMPCHCHSSMKCTLNRTHDIQVFLKTAFPLFQ